MRIFRKPITILYFLFSIVLISIAFQNCSSPFEANSVDGQFSGLDVAPGDAPTINEVKSLGIFEKTLYNDIQQNCASCHGVNQKPLFAVADSLDSHRYIFNKEYVNLQVPENSYLAIKIRAGHNNFPVEMAEQFVTSITKWSNELQEVIVDEPPAKEEEEKEGEVTTPVEPTPEEPPKEEEEVVVPTPTPAPEPVEEVVKEEHTFKYVFENIIASKCTTCHKPREDGGFGLDDDYTSYSTLMAGSSVVAGDPEGSTFYTQIIEGKMPPSGSLSEEEISYLRAWIEEGALNN